MRTILIITSVLFVLVCMVLTDPAYGYVFTSNGPQLESEIADPEPDFGEPIPVLKSKQSISTAYYGTHSSKLDADVTGRHFVDSAAKPRESVKNYAVSVTPYAIATSHKEPYSDLSTEGVYAYLGYKSHVVELEYDKLSNDSGFSGRHGVGAYTYYGIPQWHFRGGYHGIDHDTLKGEVHFAGLGYTAYNHHGYKTWGFGVRYYYSDYTSEVPVGRAGVKNFSVQQFSPYLTYNHAFDILGGYSTFELEYSSETLSEVVYEEESFSNVRGMWNQHWDRFSLGVMGWGGSSSYGVRDRGFLVYNTPDVLDSGVGMSLSWHISQRVTLKAMAEYHTYTSYITEESSSFIRNGLFATVSF